MNRPNFPSMTQIVILVILCLALLSFCLETGFLAEQKKFARVRAALKEKQALLTQKLKDKRLTLNDLNLIFVAYKDDDLLEVYAKSRHDSVYTLAFSYAICARSGVLGSKRMQGDGQVPEGFYHIDRFNPTSNFHLSLGLNYPNVSDKRKGKSDNLGGDIFIHGDCVTIGCLPMTDNIIKELYVLAIHARNRGQLKIPVYIFPFKMTDSNMATYKSKYRENAELVGFWDALKIGYDKFTQEGRELRFRIAENGDYIF